jgi:hypothetical protein
MSKVDVAAIEPLVAELLAADRWSLPVRVMEDLIAAGEATAEPLVELVRRVRQVEYRRASVWAAVVLGQVRAGAAAPVLAHEIAKSPPDALMFRVPAADALAEIGEAALPALRSLAASEATNDRLWAYYAAGLVHAAAAYDFLLDALASDATMADAIAHALVDHGNAAAVGALHQALERAEPWQRPHIEQAMCDLHGGFRPLHTRRRDWRVRYRLNALFGRYPISWAATRAITHDLDELAQGSDVPVRSLAEILGDREPTQEPHCECCGVRQWTGTGVRVCPRLAATIPVLQAYLLRRRDDGETDDIFDRLDEIEADLLETATDPEPRSRRAQERREDHLSEFRLMQAALTWAIEKHAGSVSATRVMLVSEGLRAAQQHGDPDGLFQKVRPHEHIASRRVGRNEPCPCGSGRKYKKCCESRDTAGGSEIGAGSPAVPSVRPELLAHPPDTEEDPWQAVAALPRRGPQRSVEEVPPEVAGQVVHNLLDGQYRTWPDEPLPALDGRTAREAVRDPAGRRRVTELLRSFEEAELRRPPALRYDFGWLWQELGLERPPKR